MKFTRRTFFHWSLAATALSALPLDAETKLPLTTEYRLSIVEGKLRAELFLRNTSPADIEIQTKGMGSISLRLASTDQQAESYLYRVPENSQERMELLSRLGPRPAWEVLKQNERRNFGVFQSRREHPAQRERVRLALRVNTKSGQIEFPEADVPLSRN